MDKNEKKEKMQALDAIINRCTKCELCKTAIQAVPGAGNPNADLMFIGEAPGANEDKQGLPFVGRAGKLLEFMLGQINMKREDAYIGNIIKHRPPANRDPVVNELEACKPYLTKQIEIIQPKVIATLGRFAMNYFLPSATISHAHGEAVQMVNYIVYPLYHPAAGLRNPKLKNTLIQDFLKLPEILETELDPSKLVAEEPEVASAKQMGLEI